MTKVLLAAIAIATCTVANAGILNRGPVRMMCHRTANRDVPENTLESLEMAARMGCSVVEIDLRLTLDHKIVLNHDGLLEHLTNAIGDVETTYFDELETLDVGVWMGQRFAGLRIPRFVDALHVAEDREIGLVLDLKDKGMAVPLLAALKHEGMLGKVRYGGEWADVHAAYPAANEDAVASLEPPFKSEAVEKLHAEGKTVIANFSANGHEMDLVAMRSAVAAGVDWINVDYPRLGADAIGQPIESKIAELIKKDDSAAILELSRYGGARLHAVLTRWLLADNQDISHAAALGLLTMRPAAPLSLFESALHAQSLAARRNAAWALGVQAAPLAASLIPLLDEKDPQVLEEVLLAISRCPGDVPSSRLEPFLTHANPLVRGAAALALARHAPELAAQVLPRVLAAEEATIASEYVQGRRRLSQSEIDITVGRYRGFMKMVQAAALLSPENALRFFEKEAFRSAQDYSSTIGPVAAFQLWDRIDADPSSAIRGLASPDKEVANRAEWTLINATTAVLPPVRQALHSESQAVRESAVRILAWQQDAASLPELQTTRQSNTVDPALIDWAIQKITALSVHAPAARR